MSSIVVLTLFRMGDKKVPPTSFSLVTNVRYRPQNFPNFSHFDVKFLGRIYCQSQIIELEPGPHFKKIVFLVKSL